MQKLAPILLIVLFAIVAVAALRGCIDEQRNPDVERFDPVKNFSKINSRGMMEVMAKSDHERQRESEI